jgi:hypothetical protein
MTVRSCTDLEVSAAVPCALRPSSSGVSGLSSGSHEDKAKKRDLGSQFMDHSCGHGDVPLCVKRQALGSIYLGTIANKAHLSTALRCTGEK